MKRKNSKMLNSKALEESEESKKRVKSSSETYLNSVKNADCPLNFQTSQSFFSSLLHPACTVEEFFANYWQKQLLYIPVSSKIEVKGTDVDQLKNYFHKLFNVNVYKEILENNELMHGSDIVMCKYVSGVRKNLDTTGYVKFEHVQNHFNKDKMTLQFHQPQRFHDELWKIQEKLECFFGSLIGSNIYMTPENAQGLAPHYDNVEVFILQLEGSKVWKLYEPIDILPTNCSGDLTEDDMKKTKLIKEVTLNVGDVLYFPCGTIHQAKALKDSGHSTHITLSAYASNSWMDYFATAIDHIQGNEKDVVTLRSGLPLNFHKLDVRQKHRSKLAKALQALSASVQNFSDLEVCDEITCDFFANRLPPFWYEGETIGNMPSMKGSVRLTYPDHVIFSKSKGLHPDDNCENDDDVSDLDDDDFVNDEDENFVYVYYSLKNERRSHMLGLTRNKPTGLKFDSSCWNALKKLEQGNGNYVPIKDLRLPDLLGIDMLVSLWSEGLIETKEEQ